MERPTAAIVTVGSELVEGLRTDTNTAEIARAIAVRGFEVVEAVSTGDDEAVLAEALSRLCSRHALVISTGGLGPTHDDITREAASHALSRPLLREESIAGGLASAAGRHGDPEAVEQVFKQALVVEGGVVLPATTGTAPGQIIEHPHGILALLPGPPAEMRPMLALVLERFPVSRALPAELGVTGLGESDVQVKAQRALAAYPGVALTVLARPGDVRVLLFDEGAGEDGLGRAAHAVRAEIGDACYVSDDATLAEVVIALAQRAGVTLGTVESCTGGMVASALTDVPGASAAYVGSVVSYANSVKSSLLGIPDSLLAQFGAVSEQTARAMATSAAEVLGAELVVAVTGVAGPDGGTPDKPVGLVWFACSLGGGVTAQRRIFAGGSRDSIRARATAVALDLMRRTLLGL